MYTITVVLLLGSLALEIGALKVSVSIPELVKLNDAFWLNCSHQKTGRQHNLAAPDAPTDSATITPAPTSDKQHHQSNEEIYAIKWYKDEEEFYRFLPNAEQKVSIYETNGIQLDVSRPLRS